MNGCFSSWQKYSGGAGAGPRLTGQQMTATPVTNLQDLEARLAPHFLTVLGGFNPASGEVGLPKGTRTLLLI